MNVQPEDGEGRLGRVLGEEHQVSEAVFLSLVPRNIVQLNQNLVTHDFM